MKIEEIAASFRKHCSDRGLKLDCTTSYVRRLLSKAMGKNRLSQYDHLLEQKLYGIADTADQYAFFRSSREVNLAFSFDADVTVGTNIWLAEQFHEISQDGWRVGELGCSVGVLASWLSTNYPESRFLGYDSVESFIAIANSENKAENLDFLKWDYGSEPCPQDNLDCLISCLGIDFESENLHRSTDPRLLRESEAYAFRRREAERYLRIWRNAVKDDGFLCCVLRISDYAHALAIADAAHECGWSLNLEKSQKLHFGKQSLSGLVLKAESSEKITNSEMLKLFAGKDLHEEKSVFIGTAALVKFQELKEKEILETDSKYYEGDGHTMVTSIGRSKTCGFSFSMATTNFVRLELTSDRSEIPTIRFSW